MDLSNLTLAELQTLQKQVQAELARKQQQSIIDARQQILAIVQQVGVPLETVMGGLATRAGRAKSANPVQVRYRHPEKSDLQWTGRGRSPFWVVAWEEQHGSREGITVQAAANPA
jgi:DNA-binding protein H-NS